MEPTPEQLDLFARYALSNPYVNQVFTLYRNGDYTWYETLMMTIHVLNQVTHSQQETLEYILARIPYHIELPVKPIYIL